LSLTSDMFECTETDNNFLKDIIANDGTWVCDYDTEIKQESYKWKSPCHK